MKKKEILIIFVLVGLTIMARVLLFPRAYWIDCGVCFLAMIFYSLFAGRRGREKREKGFRPEKFEEKMPFEYSKNQKIWVLFIALFLLSCSVFGVYLFMHRKYIPIEVTFLFSPLVLLIWYVLIKIGNRIK